LIDDKKIERALDSILVPGANRSPVQLNLVKSVERNDGLVRVVLADAALTGEVKQSLEESVRVAVAAVTGDDARVDFVAAKPEEVNEIRHTVAVMSGKGGVGKSLVTGLLAAELRRRGNSVGILDADLTGSSMPKMFGVEERPLGSESGILPVLTRSGMPMIAMNLLLERDDQPVIWRGPLIDKAIRQFGQEVLWGKLDYLIIDLPPGTADAVLTVMQAFPIDGVVVVFTPQDLVEMIVRKALNMAAMMKKDVLGVVENMSYLYVPELDKKLELFGPGRGEEMAKVAKAPLLAQIPVDSTIAKLCDAGDIESYDAAPVRELADELLKALGEPAP
jgi:hydrogenase maturation protease